MLYYGLEQGRWGFGPGGRASTSTALEQVRPFCKDDKQGGHASIKIDLKIGRALEYWLLIDSQFAEAVAQGAETDAEQVGGTAFVATAKRKGFFQISPLNFV